MKDLTWVKKLEENFTQNQKTWEKFPLNHPTRKVGKECAKHFSKFLNKGIPSGKESYWRGTNPNQLITNYLQKQPLPFSNRSSPLEEIGYFPNSNQLNFQNGQINTLKKDFQSEKHLEHKIKWCTWKDFNSKLPCYDWVIKQLNAQDTQTQDGFFHLASSTPLGCIIFIPPNYKSQLPLNLCFAFDDSSLNNRFWNIQNFIFISEEARLTLIENINPHCASLINMVAHIRHSKNSHLKWVRVNYGKSNGNCLSQYVCSMEEKSRLDRLSFTLGEGFFRDRVEVTQTGSKAYTNLLGLSILQQKNRSDHRFYVNHLKPNGYSRQSYTSILNNSSKSIFHGKIHVDPRAIQTDCNQSAKNLLLSDQAHCCIQPELAIDCAEVKAQHGASTGNLDENEIFYLKSRGLSFQTTWELLVFSYIKDILSQFPSKQVVQHLSQKIRKNFNELLNLKS